MRKFAYDPTLAAATLIDPIFGANSLTQDEFADAVSLINELSRFSHQFWKNGDSFNERSEADSVGVLNAELSRYISKSGPFSQSLYFETAKAVESVACWCAGYFAKLMLTGVAVKISTICVTLASCDGLWSRFRLVQYLSY